MKTAFASTFAGITFCSALRGSPCVTLWGAPCVTAVQVSATGGIFGGTSGPAAHAAAGGVPGGDGGRLAGWGDRGGDALPYRALSKTLLATSLLVWWETS